MLSNAEAILRRSARISDANKREIEEARSLNVDMSEAVAGARAAFDVVTAHRAGTCGLPENFEEDVLIRLSETEAVTEAARSLMPLHFPAAFPEVFLRDRPGFDCLLETRLGNRWWSQSMLGGGSIFRAFVASPSRR